MSYPDHFSGHARDYARARPRYPAALFTGLAALAPRRGLAWDAGTGSGQAALGLAEHFSRVVASDPSAAQVAQAPTHPRVEFRLGIASESGLEAGSADLVCAAQAAHWFDLPSFYVEAARVLRRGGVLTLWCYGLTRIAPVIDALVDRFYHDVVGPYWPPERGHIETGYRELAFPFPDQPFPAVKMQQQWTLVQFADYLVTWSAVQRYRRDRGADPLATLLPELTRAWGEPDQQRLVTWPLTGRLGTRP
jgi:SAM-dependent methyltransferase